MPTATECCMTLLLTSVIDSLLTRTGAMDGTIRDPLLEKFDRWEKEGK